MFDIWCVLMVFQIEMREVKERDIVLAQAFKSGVELC